jgi:hypothetical protein
VLQQENAAKDELHDELEVVRNTLSKVASDLTNKRAQVPTQRDSLV